MTLWIHFSHHNEIYLSKRITITFRFKAFYLHKQVERKSDKGTLTPTDNKTFNTNLNGMNFRGTAQKFRNRST